MFCQTTHSYARLTKRKYSNAHLLRNVKILVDVNITDSVNADMLIISCSLNCQMLNYYLQLCYIKTLTLHFYYRTNNGINTLYTHPDNSCNANINNVFSFCNVTINTVFFFSEQILAHPDN